MTAEAWLAKKRQLIELNKERDENTTPVKTLGIKRQNNATNSFVKKKTKVMLPSSADVLQELEKDDKGMEGEKEAHKSELVTNLVKNKVSENKVESDARQKTWQEAAREAGIILHIDEEKPESVEEVSYINTAEEVKVEEKFIGKRKKPKESRTETKIMTEDKVSESNKKTFKEAFNTDKSRLEKRQSKYSKPQNFLLILQDNVGSAACTSGKLMVYGKGNVAERFLKEGVKYNSEEFFFHQTTHNFSENMEIKHTVKKGDENNKPDQAMPGPDQAMPGPGSSQGPSPRSGASGSCSPSPGSGPRKVLTPGSIPAWSFASDDSD